MAMNERVQHDALEKFCRRARDEQGFVSFIDLCIVDRPSEDDRYECIYRICAPERGEQKSFFVKLSEHDANIDTVSNIWPAAGWFEREAFDLFGITFKGHENLTRLLTPENFEGHPLRKDFSGQGD
jgi:NADH-quinone oxidoreductase subunit C